MIDPQTAFNQQIEDARTIKRLTEENAVLRSRIQAVTSALSIVPDEVGLNIPKSLPEWRSRVEEWDNPVRTFKTPLACVLHLLSRIDNDVRLDHDPSAAPVALVDDIARVVAVCEQQVGDGWQADGIEDVERANTVWYLGRELFFDSERDGALPDDWRCLGNAAAQWLRYLTKESSK